MSNELTPTSFSKRRFVKTCLLGMGGCMLGVRPLDALGSILGGDAAYVTSTGDLWKWSKEASFYTQSTRGLKCLKCPHACELSVGQIGRCRNRVNHKGKMYTIAYGNPCAVHIDPIEKKPLFHFLPSTRAFSIAAAGCNLRCLNCQNWQISQVGPEETDNLDMMPSAVVELCLSNHCESIAYTYSEPTTFYEFGYDTAKLAREHRIRNVWKSSGYINEEPLRKLCSVIDAANIDLKGFDEEVYQKLNGVRLAPVLRTLNVFREEGVWLEITNLVIPSWTDHLDTIRKMCEWLTNNGLQNCPLHFSRFTPLYKLNQLPSTPVSTLEKAREIALAAGIHYVYIGNVPGHDAEQTYCHRCNKQVIERRGFTIISNHLTNGKCNFCGEKIPGVWT